MLMSDFCFLQADVLDAGIPSKLISLLQQQDKSVKLLACRQLATYAASAGLLQQAVASMDALQVGLAGKHIEQYHPPVLLLCTSLTMQPLLTQPLAGTLGHS
jgi:hypothetical protein